jgi:hypothetical protein
MIFGNTGKSSVEKGITKTIAAKDNIITYTVSSAKYNQPVIVIRYWQS